jgi:hypothetical protein
MLDRTWNRMTKMARSTYTMLILIHVAVGGIAVRCPLIKCRVPMRIIADENINADVAASSARSCLAKVMTSTKAS